MQKKNGKFQGGHSKFDWKYREVNFKKIDILNRGYNFLSGKALYETKKLKQSFYLTTSMER